MHEPSKRRAWRILAAVAVAAGLIAVLPGVAIWRDSPDGGVIQAAPLPSNNLVIASGNPVWSRTWGDSGADCASGIWGDGAGNVYTCGYTNSFGAGDHDFLLVKWDAVGNPLWNRTWGGVRSDWAWDIWGDSAGDIYVCGSTSSFGAGYGTLVLVKWDAAGNQLWNRTWGGSSSGGANGVWGDCAGNVYTCGCTGKFGAGGLDMVLVKWDAAGNQLWNRTWGESGEDVAEGVWGDGVGNVYSCGYSNDNLVLVKWDAAGNQIWHRTWDKSDYDRAWGVWGDGIGGVYTCGSTYIGLYPVMVLVKWDAAGNQIWNRTWDSNGQDIARGVWGDKVGNVYTCGYSNDNLVLVKWDETGNVAWNRTWDSYNQDDAWAVWGDGEGSIYACGFTGNFAEDTYDVVLVKWIIGWPGDGEPGAAWISWITWIAVAALSTLAMTMLVIKLGIKDRKKVTSAGAARRRLTSDDWLTRAAAPWEPAKARPPATRREPASHCRVCMEALPPALGRGRYCGYCGAPLAEPD